MAIAQRPRGSGPGEQGWRWGHPGAGSLSGSGCCGYLRGGSCLRQEDQMGQGRVEVKSRGADPGGEALWG